MENNKGLIKKNGITVCAKKDIKYFSQLKSNIKFTLPNRMPDIERIISVIIDYKITEINAIETMEGISQEGEHLSGCKVVVEMELFQKILYVANSHIKSVHVIENKSYKSGYIVVPKLIEGTEISKLIENKRFNVKLYIEDIAIRKINPRSIFENIFLIINGELTPAYELCYSEEYDKKRNDLFICHANGKNSTKIVGNNTKNILPKWSPAGQEIAYLSNSEATYYMLYVFNLSQKKSKQITKTKDFKCITSFCWDDEGKKIYAAARVKSSKEIFSIDTKSLEFKQLTFGNDIVKSYKPKCSFDGKKIAFIQSCVNLKNICLVNNDGVNLRKVTNSGCVKDFGWSRDNNSLVYFENNSLSKLGIYIVNVNSLEKTSINIPVSLLSVKEIKFSPKGNYISYIANDFSTQDLYLYNLNTNKTINLTKNNSNITISDYVWKGNEEKIYYTSNYLGYYNIYQIDIDSKKAIQITNSTSSNIRLSYRPRIV